MGPEEEQAIEVEGLVAEALPDEMFRIQLESGPIIVARLSDAMREDDISPALGDRVKVELSPYDLTRGTITFRYL